MELAIRSHGFSVTKALAERVRRRFSTALRHGADRLASVTIRLKDMNGPRRGGVDKQCGVELQFANGNPIVVHETDSNLYVAIDRAADRAKRNLLDRLRQRRSRRRMRRQR